MSLGYPHTVSDFDAELYLRLIGEQMLLERRGDQSRGPRRPSIAEAAAALVAVGVVSPACAESLLDDYSFAATLRNDPHFRRRAMLGASRHSGRTDHKPLNPRRVVPCRQTIEQPQATMRVRFVSLSEDATSVAVTWHAHSPRPWAGGPPDATITDDRGTTETAVFTGSGSSSEGMDGRLTTGRPLAPDAEWIELDGIRLELTGEASGFDAWLERLPEQDPAHRYLWQRIAEPQEFYENGVEPAIDALVAAGELSRDDPLLDDLRAVLEAMQQRGSVPYFPAPAGLKRLPEPWQSLLSRHGRHDGPTGSTVLGAVTPPFDGFSVAVLDLESNAKGFRVDVEVAPGVGHRMPFDWSVEPRQLAWWARDDNGNHYLGHRGNWSFNEDYGHGLISFHPALDPRAKRLELMPTAQTTRAVIGFSLPWVRKHARAAGARG